MDSRFQRGGNVGLSAGWRIQVQDQIIYDCFLFFFVFSCYLRKDDEGTGVRSHQHQERVPPDGFPPSVKTREL